ncbi:DNA (cytosine-5-)-methyltransferase, partial [Pseudanabaenaceae cyanobacterium LEGE 13415]|nr:DNA (cytosine-5-)-methyltransferase [Pseudanabaenaceae cyanobacterium LEGE 13415]
MHGRRGSELQAQSLLLKSKKGTSWNRASPTEARTAYSATRNPEAKSYGPSADAVVGIDLFAGAGGFSLGAKQAGIDIIGAVEYNKHAAATYRLNIRRRNGAKVRLLEKDILKLDPNEAMSEWELEPGRCDIILGGPPCQGFSTHRLRDSGVDDPRNALLARYFDYVAAIRPRMFLVENVPGLLWQRHADYLDQFLDMAEAADFEVIGPFVLNACDYGVPQNRKRVFILGIDRTRRTPVVWPPEPTHVSPTTDPELRRNRPYWV